MSILGNGEPAKRGARAKTRTSTRPTRSTASGSSKGSWAAKRDKRIDDLETKVANLDPPNKYPPLTRRETERLRAMIQRGSQERIAVRLGTVTLGQATTTRHTDSPFDASYPTGGEEIDLPGTFGDYTSYVIAPRVGFTFEISGTKIVAYDTADTEVTATTDLTSLNPVEILAFHNARSDRVVYEASTGERLVKAQIAVGAAVTLDTTNYWTLSLRLRRSGQTTGEDVGTAVSTATHGLTAQTPVTIYDVATGLTMTDGERLVLYVSETANPEVLEDLVLWLTIQREVN